jgi:hypothetical protein
VRTLASLRCRLGILVTMVADAPELDAVRTRVASPLARAKTLLGRSSDRCAAAKRRPARQKLRQAGRRVGQLRRILHTKPARSVPRRVVEAFSERAMSLRADALSLAHVLACPDAP